ncbi:cation transporter [Lentibacillus salinarum]|uniref:Copper chaperone CopZ n=1 Tax=Lentibacillus salinarum TaxID=446820 RepID=A0ABW4A048_9BACI
MKREIVYFDVKGMHCPDCKTKIEKAVSAIPGVKEVSVNLTAENGQVAYESHLTGVPEIIRVIQGTGFDAAEQSGKSV